MNNLKNQIKIYKKTLQALMLEPIVDPYRIARFKLQVSKLEGQLNGQAY